MALGRDLKLRIYSGIRANTHNYFSHRCVPEAVVLIEKHDSESLIYSLPLSPHLFSVTRGLAGDEPM